MSSLPKEFSHSLDPFQPLAWPENEWTYNNIERTGRRH